jgi:UDP-glucose 4-epimerase
MTASLEDAYRGRSVCVTGGAGFIGSHLCDALTRLGARVSVIDDLSSGATENLDGLDVRFVRASILDPAALLEAVGDSAVIYHHAALTSVPDSVERPQAYHEVNATGTLSVLEAARVRPAADGATPPRIVFAASSSAYGDLDADPIVETVVPRPLSPYAVAKCTGEQLLRAYCLCYGISGVSLRYFNIFGPRQPPGSSYAAVIPLFATALLDGVRPTIFGDGSQTRDFTHVSNVVQANLLAGASTKPLAGEIVNVGCGIKTTVLELLERIAAVLGVEPDAEFAPARIGDVLHSRADITRAAELLGYEPVTDLDTGLRDTLTYYKK